MRFGLYAEQMTATAFVAPRHLNKKAWCVPNWFDASGVEQDTLTPMQVV